MSTPVNPIVSPAMTSPSAANGTTPLMSPLSNSGVKRKRASTTSRDGSTTESREDADPPTPPKKRRPDRDAYNVKYMASMCYNTHATRRDEAGLKRHTKDEALFLEQSLIEVFKEVQSGQIFERTAERTAVAQDTLPIFARKAPFEKVSNVQLMESFIEDYNRICGGLDLLDQLAIDIQVDEELLEYLHRTVSCLHYDVATALMWHDLLPYTPLSLLGLRQLRDRITRSEQYRLLAPMLGSINDIERWLSLPPRRLHLSEQLKKVAMAAMQEETEEKLRNLKEHDRPERLTLDQQVAKIREEEAKREQEKVRKDLDKARRLEEALVRARVAQEKADREKKEAAQREAEAEAAAQRKLQEMKKHKDEADAAERRNKKKQEEDAARKAKEAEKQKKEEEAAKKREKLRAEEEAHRLQEVEAAKLEKLRIEKQQQEEATKATWRMNLQKKAEMHRDALRALAVLVTSGQASSAKLDELNAPTKQSCLQILSDLWDQRGDLIATISPQELLANSDMLLEFDVHVITEARCAMAVLHCRSGSAQELDMTGWQPEPMAQLKSRIWPFANQACLAELKVGVDAICDILEEARRGDLAETRDYLSSSTSTQRSQNTSLGSSMSSNTTVNIEDDFSQKTPEPQQFNAIPAPMTGVRKYNPLLDPARTNIGPTGLPIPDADFVAQHNPFITHSSNDDESSTPTNTASIPKIRNPQECKFGSKCSRGDDCDYTHPWDIVADAPMDAPCYHFFRLGFCKHGNTCQLSHNTLRFGPPSTGRQPRQPPRKEELDPLDISLGDRIAADQYDARSRIPYRDGENCTRGNCVYKHDHAAKASNGVPLQNRGLGNSLLGVPRGPRNGSSGSQGGPAFGYNANARRQPRQQHPSHPGGALNRQAESSSDEDLYSPFVSERNFSNDGSRRGRPQSRATTENNGVKRERNQQRSNRGAFASIRNILQQNAQR